MEGGTQIIKVAPGVRCGNNKFLVKLKRNLESSEQLFTYEMQFADKEDSGK